MFLEYSQKEGFSDSNLGDTWKGTDKLFDEWIEEIGYTRYTELYVPYFRSNGHGKDLCAKIEIYEHKDGSYLYVYADTVEVTVHVRVASASDLMALRIAMAPIHTADTLTVLLPRTLEVQERMLRLQHSSHSLEAVCPACDPEEHKARVEEKAVLRKRRDQNENRKRN